MLSLSLFSTYKHSAPTLSAVESAHPVPEEFRSSGTDLRRRPANPALATAPS